ncbi:MAG: TauD/TfdA family dioxygenase [Sphingomonadaceae bacterium]|nr:TauD/TfdA family dioxygenase [Sphingomonadaceae bacterium]
MAVDFAREDGWPNFAKKGWSAAEFDGEAPTRTLTARQIALLLTLADRTKELNLAVVDITREVFDHPELHEAFADWARAFRDGQGLLTLRGLPVRERPLDDIWRIYWGIGAHFGIGVSQNTHGQLQGTVAVQPGGVGARVYATSTMAPLHCDRIDILSLLCINKARSGGENVFASSLKVWELIEAERPDILARLKRGYPQHRNHEEPEGCAPVTPYRVPVFGEADGLRSAYYGGNAMLVHQEQMFAEILTDADREALIYLADVMNRPELALRQTLEPGDAVFINNMELTHSRTAFEDGDDPAERRLLLRLWLQGRPCRPIPQDMRVIHNPSGMLGIERKDVARAAAD